jgi:glucose/mannose-6-phosphate isomerase
MDRLLRGFADQCRDAISIARQVPLPVLSRRNLSQVVVSGLGGSAIGGDLLRSYLLRRSSVPLSVNRSYDLPRTVDSDSLVFVSSYSGNTEETLAAFSDARKRRARIVAFTSGGALAERCRRARVPVVRIPAGFPPRAALAYSFFSPLILLERWGLIPSQKACIAETLLLLARRSRLYADGSQTEGNLARQIAEHLQGSLPIIYASDHLEAVLTRFRNQLNENSKILAHSHVFPELNHNEIVGWEVSRQIMARSVVLLLRDRDEHPRVSTRIEITRDLLGRLPRVILEVRSEGRSLLARMFSLVHLGDWVSYYLALLNRVDPTPVRKIDLLKTRLARG